MRLALRRRELPTLPGAVGQARLAVGVPGTPDPARATRELAARLLPGEVAVIDQLDLDRVSAELLVAARPAAVVNVRASLSGRHPARGASVIVDAGVPLLDAVGPGLLSSVRDGQRLRVHDSTVFDAVADDGLRVLGTGQRRSPADVARAVDAARARLASRLESVGADTAAVVRAHEALLLEGDGLPDLREVGLDLRGRPVLVVAPGERAAADLAAVRGFVRDRRPVLVGAEGGAALIAAAGLDVDLVVGEAGAVGARALSRAVQVPRAGVPSGFSATDLAVLLADVGGAELVVLAGAPVSYDEMFDRDRYGSASALAVRMRAGGRLVDAEAVAALQRPTVRAGSALLLLVAGLLALLVALAVTPWGTDLVDRVRGGWPW